MEEEVTIEKKFKNWNVWRDGTKKNIITFVPMTPGQALKHFKADAVEGLEKEYIDHFGMQVNAIEGRVS